MKITKLLGWMRRSAIALILASLVISSVGLLLNHAAPTPSLRLIAIGDMPYSEAENIALEGRITQAIRTANPSFVVHYGDIKASREVCTEALLSDRRDEVFNLLPGRVFYTPGDNEWTDCDRQNLSFRVPELTTLKLIRQLFFSQPLDLPTPWAYAQQAELPENARWMQNGILFATVHMVGTNNGRAEILLDQVETALDLVDMRDKANQVWLEAAFQEAHTHHANAVVIVTQADVTAHQFKTPCTPEQRIQCDAFANFREQFIQNAAQFHEEGQPAKPVLLVHGDTKPYCLDPGFGGEMAPNLWRLNAWGDYQAPPDATEITVQPGQLDAPFVATTLLGRQSPMLCN